MSPSTTFDPLQFIKSHVGLVIGAIITVIALIVGISVFSSVNNARNGVITREQALITQYQDNQNELSAYILKFNETLGIADRQNDALNEVLLNAVKGRYDNDGLQPGTGGSMFSAITEAYPDLSANSEAYMKVQDQIVAGREAYKNKQTKLLDMIRDYRTFIKTDIYRAWLIETFIGAPTDDLRIVENNQVYEGKTALDKISQIVLTQDARDAYETGNQDPLITPKDKSTEAE